MMLAQMPIRGVLGAERLQSTSLRCVVRVKKGRLLHATALEFEAVSPQGLEA
jgi:hypothetical protein